MWFVLGVLCGIAAGVAVFLCLPKEKRSLPPASVRYGGKHVRQEWAETRNFLYYDGTEMPEVKEKMNE